MKIDSMQKLYAHELKDLYSAENQILEALPKLIDTASDNELTNHLKTHFEETQSHVKRLEMIFKDMEFAPGGHRCRGMEGLVSEGRNLLDDVEDAKVIDAAIIAICQRMEHYEIAGYGVARAFADKLGRGTDVEALTETIEEEGACNRRLSQLAEHHINFVATTTGA